MHREVIKIGSGVICGEQGISAVMTAHIASEVAALRQGDKEIIIISSGAARAGSRTAELAGDFAVEVVAGIRKQDVRDQVRAAVGQIDLITHYRRAFAKYGLICAQVLVTRHDFEERDRYVKLHMVVENLLRNNVVPIFNENDVLSHAGDAFDFRDNDHLACVVAAMLAADRLTILTNAGGIYDRPPREPGARLLSEITNPLAAMEQIKIRKADTSKGGAVSKMLAGRLMSSLGIPLYIVGGDQTTIRNQRPLTQVIAHDQNPGTCFPPAAPRPKKIKSWIMTTEGTGAVIVSTFLAERLRTQTFTSILLRGIEDVAGVFSEGDVVLVTDQSGAVLGKGQVRCDSDKLRRDIERERCSQTNHCRLAGGEKIVIHYDYFVFA